MTIDEIEATAAEKRRELDRLLVLHASTEKRMERLVHEIDELDDQLAEACKGVW